MTKIEIIMDKYKQDVQKYTDVLDRYKFDTNRKSREVLAKQKTEDSKKKGSQRCICRMVDILWCLVEISKNKRWSTHSRMEIQKMFGYFLKIERAFGGDPATDNYAEGKMYGDAEKHLNTDIRTFMTGKEHDDTVRKIREALRILDRVVKKEVSTHHEYNYKSLLLTTLRD